MKISCVYAIINKINGMVYIGKSINYSNRMIFYKNNCHKDQSKLYNATQKYGWDNFSIEIVEEVDPEKLFEREKYWIRYLNTFDIYNNNSGYNLTIGGDGACFGIYNSQFGKKRKDLSELNKQRKKDKTFIGKNNPMFGKRNVGAALANKGRKRPDVSKRLREDNPSKNPEIKYKISQKAKNRTDIERDEKGRFLKND